MYANTNTVPYFPLKYLKEQKKKKSTGSQNKTNFHNRNGAYWSCMYIQIEKDIETFPKALRETFTGIDKDKDTK